MGVEDWEGEILEIKILHSLWSLQDFGATSDNSKVQSRLG